MVLKIGALCFLLFLCLCLQTTHGTCLIILILVTLAGVGREVRKDFL